MLERIDSSPRIKSLLQWVSTWLAQRRGLPIFAAIGIGLLSFVVHVLLALIPGSPLLSLCAFTLLHAALLLGLVGFLLAEPLGKG